ncbi:MAG TPA: zinc-finger domain-containing protein [Acidocella sp.]|nr:zinc-finger domain-containing protein [Acidocella sp.]
MSAQTQPTEIVHVQTRTVSCDGGVGTLGHPRVYLRITDHQVTCPYCSKIFVLEEGATDSGH